MNTDSLGTFLGIGLDLAVALQASLGSMFGL
jgi:hypothetical protein